MNSCGGKEGEQMIKLKNRKRDDKNQEKTRKPKMEISIRIPILLLFIIAIAGGLIWKVSHIAGSDIAEKGNKFLVGEEGKVTTVTESVLEKSVKRSNMYTAEYPYNGYTTVYDDGQETVKYYAAYEGTVKAGIDVSKIKVFLDEATGTIIIQLPEVIVAEPWVNPGTMEYIFENEKYNTETVAQEAYKAALADLSERISADTKLAESAAENAKISARALVEPWVNQMGGGEKYSVTVLLYGEEDEDE